MDSHDTQNFRRLTRKVGPGICPDESIPVVRKAWEHIVAHPEEHDQMVIFRRTPGECGSAACLAGWISYFSGDPNYFYHAIPRAAAILTGQPSAASDAVHLPLFATDASRRDLSAGLAYITGGQVGHADGTVAGN